jgi:uncharacterized protein
MSKFKVGQSILYREIDGKNQIIDVKPMVVVEDSEKYVILWCPLGTLTKGPVLAKPKVKGETREWVDGLLKDGVWKYAEILVIIRKNEKWATWIKWNKERIFQGFYVNLQSELNRHHLGFDIRDHQLDIEVSPDKVWNWKDQHELDYDVECGKFTDEEAKHIRENGNDVISNIENKKGVIYEEWEKWKPSRSWKKPSIPINWDDKSMYE